MTYVPVVRAAAQRLAAAGIASPRADAELLAAHVLGVSRGRLALAGSFSAQQRHRYESLVAARADRVPLQHLTGSTGFGALELSVGPGVFVPRPETELLLEWALGLAGPDRGVVVDLCSGTGALALAVAYEWPQATVYAVESAPDATGWLRRNAAARRAAGDRPVEVVASDATDPAVLAGLDASVDLVVCNPPYVPAAVPVPPEVADHDPPQAVFAGSDGLAVIRPVIARAAALLRPGGALALEHDDTHGQVVPRLLRDGGFTAIEDHGDLAGRPRFATAHRPRPDLASI